LYNVKDFVNAQNCKELEKLSFIGVDFVCNWGAVTNVKPFIKKKVKKLNGIWSQLLKIKLVKKSEVRAKFL
jgi:hypothetical protein